MEAILAAASAVLGAPVTDPVPLAGGGRTTVLRCRAGAGSVVIKAYRSAPDALSSFTAEAAALALGVAGPRLLAVDYRFPLLVLADLGTAGSLADRLLDSGHGSATAAEEALASWATALGQLAAATQGRESELAALQRRYDRGHRLWQEPGWQADRQAEFAALLPALGLAPPPGLPDDLDRLLAATAPHQYPVFSPGDLCPDNTLLTGDGPQLVDFEGAGYHSVFLDAAYLRMPFATCWCVFRLPAAVAARIEAGYRAQLAGVYPDLADDAVWQPGVRRAAAAWTVSMSALLLPRALAADEPVHRSRRPVPTRRQLLRYRWQWLQAELAGASDLPALAGLLGQLLAATGDWAVAPLPVYPAYR